MNYQEITGVRLTKTYQGSKHNLLIFPSFSASHRPPPFLRIPRKLKIEFLLLKPSIPFAIWKRVFDFYEFTFGRQ